MKTVLIVLTVIALIGVVAALFTGVVLMGRGGEANARWGNKLMRARVGLQLIAVVLLLLLFAVYQS
ncbi:MAG: twin transmembrane helix small protein [Rhodospirillaceae bacterium]|nr:twin transmembrane helix small protein [Rhodospirillaceae bacterium]MDE0617853.1 twin transmembrane helix small protein [Rhodospirillaceae bacterium]MXY39786.1 twin transmembrane helix small protein [Rhodospirillaceae bacterium]MYF07635.1 twin transmembrane helix small protein [Rhodospirillaceae bacterium]MYF85166.1 twin transmembrane helix small protein [Rhodospirillaceae bacterium]